MVWQNGVTVLWMMSCNLMRLSIDLGGTHRHPIALRHSGPWSSTGMAK